MKFNIGKLYEIKQYFWMLYPSKETAATGTDRRGTAAALAAVESAAPATAEYWSKQLNCNVSYIKEQNIITLLEQDSELIHVLTSNGLIGWMYVPNKDWVNRCFKEKKP